MCLPLQERRAFRGTKLLPLKRHNKKNNNSTDTASFYFPQGCWRGNKCVSDVETEVHRGGLTCGGHIARHGGLTGSCSLMKATASFPD